MVLALETSLQYGRSSAATQFQVCFQADCAFVPPRNVHAQLVFLLQQISFLSLTMNSVLLTFKLDLERVTTIQHVNYLGQRSVCLKVIAGTHRYRQTDSQQKRCWAFPVIAATHRWLRLSRKVYDFLLVFCLSLARCRVARTPYPQYMTRY